MSDEVRIRRLTIADVDTARRTFALMSEAFETPAEPLSDAYLQRVLASADFFAFAALAGDEPLGGLTAHVLAMTRAEVREIFLYDLAVHERARRRGVARALVRALLGEARSIGIDEVFVPADADDPPALAFYRALGAEESAVRFFSFAARRA